MPSFRSQQAPGAEVGVAVALVVLVGAAVAVAVAFEVLVGAVVAVGADVFV